jgi:glucosamine 6-phosphate synthetase-like amidotransferase/phosphosugar isomerase protein
VFEKTVSNMQSVVARCGPPALIGEKHATREAAVALEHLLVTPDGSPDFGPIVWAAPIHTLTYIPP